MMASLEEENLLMDQFVVNDEDEDDEEDIERSTDFSSEDSVRCIHMALIVCGGSLGAAAFDANNNEMHLLSDVAESNDFSMTKSLLAQVEPTDVIISNKSDESLVQLLMMSSTSDTRSDTRSLNDGHPLDANRILSSVESRRNETMAEDEMFLNPRGENEVFLNPRGASSGMWSWSAWNRLKVDFVNNNAFCYETAKRRLLSLNLSSGPLFASENEKFIYISSMVNFSHTNMIRAAGALLSYLDKKRVGIQLEDEDTCISVSKICCIDLQELVSMDYSTLTALQVFHNEWHPATNKQGIQMRESLSLFSLFNRCGSRVGSRFMRKLFLTPTQDIDVINNRLDAIEFFSCVQNLEVKNYFKRHLKQINDVNTIVNHMKFGKASVNEWKTLFKTVMNALLIKEMACKQIPISPLLILCKIASFFTQELLELANAIKTVVDFESSVKSKHFQVNAGVDESLDEIKRVFKKLPDVLNEMVKQENALYEQYFHECNCIYIPQIGFLLSVPQESVKSPNSYESIGLIFVFKSDGRVFYKSPNMKKLDEEFGDLGMNIYDRQIQIMNKLQVFVVQKKRLLNDVTRCCAELDCLIAMAETAIEYNYSKPSLTSNDCIEILGGRHPLAEVVTQSFVPNHTLSGGEYTKLKIITGPNCCGKSVYLKQICLIVYLAHIGSFVPADSANISIVDKIFTRMYSQESMATGLSSFMTDLNLLSNAVRHSTFRSLVLIDEFGSGTQSIDGISLLASCLRHWMQNKRIPHIFVSTHFHSLKSFIPNNHLFTNLTFRVMMNEGKLVYLYQMMEGGVDESDAIRVAESTCVPQEVISRAVHVRQLMQSNTTIEPHFSEVSQNHLREYILVAENLLSLNLESDEEIEKFIENVRKLKI